jgi:hypothetical protein
MFSADKRGTLWALALTIPGVLLVLFSGSGPGKVLGGLSIVVFGLFAYVNYFSARPERELPGPVVDALEGLERSRPNEHKVTLILDDGRVVANVTVIHGRYVELPLGRARLRFSPKQVVAVRPD